jgi:hypothetical protein
MLEDGIIETSNSPILNPLTVVQREGKKIRICVDARKIKSVYYPRPRKYSAVTRTLAAV